MPPETKPAELQAEIAKLDLLLAQKSAELDAVRAGLKREILELTQERDVRVAELAARKKLAGMSPAERAAVVALIQPAGVAPGSKVGTPGSQ
jgi:hypothetical protein